MTKFYNISTDNTLGGTSPSDVTVSSQKAVKEYIANISITYTLNTNVNVAGNTKDVAHIYPEAIFARGGLIMGGTASAAGLVTRGICGSSTPNATTGACSKDRLYLNYDGDTTWNPSGRGVVINAGSYGTDLGQGMYSYCAVRGDIVKAWVDAQGYALSSSIPTVNDGTLTISKNGTTAGTFTANQSTASNVNIDIDGVLNSRDDTTVVKTWVGTKAQYDAITTKDNNTLYNVTDDSTALSIPSTKFTDLTLGASGATYTAPADGWIYFRKKASATNQYVALIKFLEGNINIEASVMWSVSNTTDLYANMPVRKGEVFGVTYSAGGATGFFKFVYAVGSESEAT